MTRVVAIASLVACAMAAAPVSAQVNQEHWFASTGVGPSFGTFGSTPVVDALAGYRIIKHFSIIGEFGVLPHAPFDKAGGIAPAVSPVVPTSDVHVNGYHANANLFVQPSAWGRFTPYVTAGFGAFTGSTVASASLTGSRVVQYDHETNPASNVGAGTTYRLTPWFGLNADYRHFIVNAAQTEHVNRFATGVSFFVK